MIANNSADFQMVIGNAASIDKNILYYGLLLILIYFYLHLNGVYKLVFCFMYYKRIGMDGNSISFCREIFRIRKNQSCKGFIISRWKVPFVMIVYIRKFSNIERMAIIDKGLSPDLFKKESSSSGTLRAALLLIGIGIGFLMGVWLDRAFDLEETGYFSMLFIFGGLGLGIAYLIEEKKAKAGR